MAERVVLRTWVCLITSTRLDTVTPTHAFLMLFVAYQTEGIVSVSVGYGMSGRVAAEPLRMVRKQARQTEMVTLLWRHDEAFYVVHAASGLASATSHPSPTLHG